jgi:molybdate transport system ATP-binding protein
LFDHLAGIDRPAHKRMIRLVAQRPALFPHRSVFGNVTWATPGGPAFDRGRPIPEALDQILTICRMQHLLNKMPAGLSGGERQRVALARSLAASPMNLLLLDEPFTGIEADLRDAIIHDLRSYLAERGIPVLLVTHDLGEVFASRAEVLKMHAGRIVAQGPAEQVLAAERDRLVARLRSAAPTL